MVRYMRHSPPCIIVRGWFTRRRCRHASSGRQSTEAKHTTSPAAAIMSVQQTGTDSRRAFAQQRDARHCGTWHACDTSLHAVLLYAAQQWVTILTVYVTQQYDVCRSQRSMSCNDDADADSYTAGGSVSVKTAVIWRCCASRSAIYDQNFNPEYYCYRFVRRHG